MAWVAKTNLKGPPGIQGIPGPQGLPGLNAIPADEAVAGYIATEGSSETKTALDAGYVASGEIVINVAKDFGAVGDGVTDDSAAFVAAFDEARRTKRRVYLPKTSPTGKYFLPGTIDFSGVVMYGDLNGYYSKGGTIIVGDGTNTVFSQQNTSLDYVSMGVHGIRFENVRTALEFSYSIYSRVSDVSVIDATGDAIILGNNTIIGPIWNVFERVKVNSINGYGIVLQGKDWCNANLFDTCYFKGSFGAVRINSSGGFGAVANVFRNTEATGTGPGYVFDGRTQSTTIEGGYIEPAGPAVVIRETTTDLQLQGNVYGSSGNDVPGYSARFIDHQSGLARVRIIGGWITTNPNPRQANMDFVGSDAPASLGLTYVVEPSKAITSTGFKLHDVTTISAETLIQHGNLTVQKYGTPSVAIQYPDGSRPFTITRNGSQGGVDFGVEFTNGGIKSFLVSNLGNLTLLEDLASNKTTTATSAGTLTRKMTIRDASGNILGYIPIYNNIT